MVLDASTLLATTVTAASQVLLGNASHTPEQHLTSGTTSGGGNFLQKIFIDVDAMPNDGYGFCQLAFLAAAYAYVLMQGANLIKDGSELLLLIPSWSGLVGSIVLPVLGAVPDGAIVLFSGMGPKAEAQKQLAVGVGALAGSTIMLLTVPWFLSMMAGRVNMDSEGHGNYVRPRGAGPEWKKLTPGRFKGTGVNVGPSITHAAIVMAVTLIPFFVMQIPAMIARCSTKHDEVTGDCDTPKTWAIIAGVLTVLLFIFYLVDQYRQSQKGKDLVTEGKVDQQRQRAIDDGLMTLKGIFKQTSGGQNDTRSLSRSRDVLLPGAVYSSTRSALIPQPGSPASPSWERSRSPLVSPDAAAVAAARLRRNQPLTEDLIVSPAFGRLLKPYFRRFDVNRSGTLERNEFRLLLEVVGENPTAENSDAIFNEIDTDRTGSVTFDKFVHAMRRVMLAEARGETSPAKDALAATVAASDTAVVTITSAVNEPSCSEVDEDEEEEEDEIPDDLIGLSPEEQRRRILQRAFLRMGFGTLLVLIFSDPMVDVLAKLGDMTHIPAFYVSFVLAPLVSNGSELIAAYAYAGKKTEKTMTIALATLVGSSAMNNTFCLSIFLFLVAGRGLEWVFTAEVMSIVLVEVAMLVLIFVCRTSLRTWTAGLVIALYPMSLVLVWFLENVAELD